MADDKKKRGRPKRPNDSVDDTEKKTRKKKTETVLQMPTVPISNTRDEHTYMVILDVKSTDVDTTIIDVNKKFSEQTVFDDLIEMFSTLIKERKSILENSNSAAINQQHQELVSPDKVEINFLSNNTGNSSAESNVPILPIFKVNGDLWPSQSPYSCWNCDCQFDNSPIGIPEYISNGQFYCFGNFCTFSCAGRYIMDMDHTTSSFDKLSLLNTLYQMTYNLDVTEHLIIANKKEVLYKYGGTQTYSQYHQVDANNSKQPILYKLPIIPVYCYIYNQESNLDSLELDKTHLEA